MKGQKRKTCKLYLKHYPHSIYLISLTLWVISFLREGSPIGQELVYFGQPLMSVSSATTSLWYPSYQLLNK